MAPGTQGRVGDHEPARPDAGSGHQSGPQAAPEYGWSEQEHRPSELGYSQQGYAAGTGTDLPGSGRPDAGQAGARQPGAGQPGAGQPDPSAQDHDPLGGYPWADDDPSAANPWSDGGLTDWNQAAQPTVSNAIRGFPPAPGDPPPVYPGPFAAWNRTDRSGSDRAGRRAGAGVAGQLATATITPDEFDTNHSIPAIKDPIPSAGNRAGSTGPTRVASARSGTAGGGQATDQAGRTAARDGQGRARSAKPAGQSARSGARARRGGKHQSVWLAIAFAVVIIIVGAVVLVLTSPGSAPRSTPKAGGKPTPVKSSPQPPGGKWKYIGSRSTDSVPLTMHELYPATFTAGVASYAKVKEAKSANCSASLIGSVLKGAVRHGKCTQAVRATYVSQIAGLMATIGVFNLNTATQAEQAATKAGHFNFVAQLKSTAGPGKSIGEGTGIEEASFKGHYLVLVWAEFTNLTAPRNAADRAKLGSFMNLLIQHTVNLSLSNRMVDGKPLQRSPASP